MQQVSIFTCISTGYLFKLNLLKFILKHFHNYVPEIRFVFEEAAAVCFPTERPFLMENGLPDGAIKVHCP